MANMTSNQEQLKYTVGLQIGVTIAAIVFTMMYTRPKFETIQAQTVATNAVLQKYEQMYNEGISYSLLSDAVTRVGNNAELSELIVKNPEKVKEFLAKTDAEKSYSDWLSAQMNASEDDKIRFLDAQTKINSIIPSLSPISNHQNAKSVTLRDYVTFVEKELLSQHGIQSDSPVGIVGVKYQEDEEGNIKHPVGEFLATFSIKGTNGNIWKMLNFLAPLGNPALLFEEGIAKNLPAVMSNPLVTIDKITLKDIPTASNFDAMNEGQLVLKFYVRGSSTMDMNYLLWAFEKKRVALANDIQKKIDECQSNASTCVSWEALEAVQKKFAQFEKVLSETLKNRSENSIEVAYIIAQQVQTLQFLRTEFENIK